VAGASAFEEDFPVTCTSDAIDLPFRCCADRASAATGGGGANTPPVTSLPPSTTVTIGDWVSVNAGQTFSDQDGDALSFLIAGLPRESGLSFDTATGVLSGVPTAFDAMHSPLILTLAAVDPKGGRVEALLYVTVLPGKLCGLFSFFLSFFLSFFCAFCSLVWCTGSLLCTFCMILRS
jgi:hypothetical protein